MDRQIHDPATQAGADRLPLAAIPLRHIADLALVEGPEVAAGNQLVVVDRERRNRLIEARSDRNPVTAGPARDIRKGWIA